MGNNFKGGYFVIVSGEMGYIVLTTKVPRYSVKLLNLFKIKKAIIVLHFILTNLNVTSMLPI